MEARFNSRKIRVSAREALNCGEKGDLLSSLIHCLVINRYYLHQHNMASRQALLPCLSRGALLRRANHSVSSSSCLRATAAQRTMSTTNRLYQPSSLSGVKNVAATSAFPSPHPLRLTPPSASEETADFKRACDEVQAFFDSPRFKGIKRPYGPAAVVSKRGSVPATPPQSSLMADKLFSLFRHRYSKGEPVHTMGAIDPVQQSQMAYHQEVTYVSGWAASSVLTTCSNEVGPDLADYPYTTVPNQVQVSASNCQSRLDLKHALLTRPSSLSLALRSVSSRLNYTMTESTGTNAVSSRRNSAKRHPGWITFDQSLQMPTQAMAA